MISDIGTCALCNLHCMASNGHIHRLKAQALRCKRAEAYSAYLPFYNY